MAAFPVGLFHRCGSVLAVTVALGGWCVAGDEAEQVPAILRRPDRLAGVRVVQKRGWVKDAADVGDVIHEGYWTLDDETAVGTVRGVCEDGTFEVEFADSTGWSRVDFQVTSVEKVAVTRDHYGDVVNVERWEEKGLKVRANDHGLIIEEDGERRAVRFPGNCLALAPLKVGDKVIRGPDWNRGFSDGGDSPKPEDVSHQCYGEVIAVTDADNYVLIEWDKTGIRERCRFDCRRRYDVFPFAADRR